MKFVGVFDSLIVRVEVGRQDGTRGKLFFQETAKSLRKSIVSILYDVHIILTGRRRAGDGFLADLGSFPGPGLQRNGDLSQMKKFPFRVALVDFRTHILRDRFELLVVRRAAQRF